MDKSIKLNMKDIDNTEDYNKRRRFLDLIENIIENVKRDNFKEAANLMIKNDISLVFLSSFTIRLKTTDIFKLGDEITNLLKK